jgi:hypothetical protein
MTGRHNTMNLKTIFAALVALPLICSLAWAHHGWSSFDETKPVYIEGVVKSVKWENPHAEVVLEVAEKLAVPADLAKRSFPRQVSPTVTPDLVAKATAPKSSKGAWQVELAPLTRMEAWGLKTPLKAGDKLSMIGFVKQQGNEKLMRVEILYTPDGKAFGLRSAPAP